VNITADRLGRLALVAIAAAAAIGLAACGRKGPLDPPPTAALTNPQPVTPRPSLGEENDGLAPSPSDDQPRPQRAAPAAATASPPPPRSFFLDFLIGR